MSGNKNVFVYDIDNNLYTKPIYKNNIQEQVKSCYIESNEQKYIDIIKKKNRGIEHNYDLEQAWYWWQVERFQYPYY